MNLMPTDVANASALPPLTVAAQRMNCSAELISCAAFTALTQTAMAKMGAQVITMSRHALPGRSVARSRSSTNVLAEARGAGSRWLFC
jgi:hypothetical protein